MNSQDLRYLQEAYMKGYQELDEAERPLPYGRMMKKSDELADSDDKKKRNRAAKIYLAANAPKGPKVKVRKEQVDLYDIILSHLLDEGYAETPEAAEKIMVHMSEDWRDSIVEGLGGAKNQDDYEEREKERKRVRDEHLGKYERGELPFQKQKKAEKAQEFLKRHPKKKK